MVIVEKSDSKIDISVQEHLYSFTSYVIKSNVTPTRDKINAIIEINKQLGILNGE